MSTNSSSPPTAAALEIAYPPVLPPKDLPYDGGDPLESYWHFLQIALLGEVVSCRFDALDDFCVGGNMFVYFNLDQLKNQDFRGPDFFYVKGVPRYPMRKYWAIWDEGGRFPDLIIELLSPTTARTDRTVKKEIYEKTFRTPEYFLYDPDADRLEGFRLDGHQTYQPIDASERGWLWSERLGGWLGTWQGDYRHRATWLRLYDEQGNLWPTFGERATAEIASLKARINELENKGP